MSPLVIAGAIGFFAGMLATAGIAVALRKLGQKLGWKRRYRPHRYEEIL